jgi:iron(III) transport system permease protein
LKARLAGIVLILAWIGVLGWPLLATILEAWGASWPDRETGGVVRPLRLAWETVRIVLTVEALALPLGVALAMIVWRTDAWGRRLVLGLLMLQMFIPLPLYAIAWLGALGNTGRAQLFGTGPILQGWLGAAIVHALAALPWVVVLAGVGLRSVEPELEEAALLDRPAWRVLARVTVRRAVGALAAVALVVAVLTAGDMTVTDLLVVRTYAEEAYLQYGLGNGPGAAAAVALPPLAVLGLGVVVAAWALLRADPSRLASPARAKTWRLGRWRFVVGLGVLALALVLVGLPVFSLFWRAGRVGGAAALGRPPHWSLEGLKGTLQGAAAEIAWPLGETMAWSALAALGSVAIAWPLAWMSRGLGAWRGLTAATVALTLATPGPVAGMALVLAYRSVPIVYDSAAILVLAGVLRTLPFALLVLWPALRTIPPELLETAAVEGYGRWGQVFRVALPMSKEALVAAWGIAWVLALGELPATNLVAPPGLNPLPVLIWSLLHTGVESHLAGVALVLLATIAAVGSLTAWTLGRLRIFGGSVDDHEAIQRSLRKSFVTRQ